MSELDSTLFNYLETTETAESFSADQLVLNSQVLKLEKEGNITLKEGQDIVKINKLKNLFTKTLSRKNILYLGKFVQELPVEITEAQGYLALPILNKGQIERKIESMPPEERTKIGWIHISTIQIIVKSTYLKGIDSPITLIVRDRRIQNPQLSIIGSIRGNLKYSIVKFNVSLQYALSLLSPKIDEAIGIQFKFEKQELMKKDEIPFSITYATGYALSNSHHSIQFANKERIYVDQIFEQTSTKRIIIRKEETPQYGSINKNLVPAESKRFFDITDNEGTSNLRTFEEKIDKITKDIALLNRRI